MRMLRNMLGKPPVFETLAEDLRRQHAEIDAYRTNLTAFFDEVMLFYRDVESVCKCLKEMEHNLWVARERLTIAQGLSVSKDGQLESPSLIPIEPQTFTPDYHQRR